MPGQNIQVLFRSDNGTHRGDIETKEHTTHRGNASQKVNIVDLGELLEHGGKRGLGRASI